MTKENNSLSRLLLLLLSLTTCAFEEQTCAGSDDPTSTCESWHSWPLSVDSEASHGLELLQMKGVKSFNQRQGSEYSTNQRSLEDVATSTKCNHYLSGVDDEAVHAVLDRKGGIPSKSDHRGSPEASARVSSKLSSLQEQRIFIAALLHQSADIMQHWTMELLRLAIALKSVDGLDKLFISVYESGSTDSTVDHLLHLEKHLKFLGVPSLIVTGGRTRKKSQRIDFLADIRNKVMEPLRASKDPYDRVLWLSDSIFCADGVLQMLAHALSEREGGIGADAVCGMDYWDYKTPVNSEGERCGFYDKWATHDIAGNNFANFKPIVRSKVNGSIFPGPGNDKLEAGEPFQVFSCWNAMVVFKADIFQQDHLSFRSARTQEGECPASEAELIFRDMWNIGRGKILVSPRAASAYIETHWLQCAANKQPFAFDKVSPVIWQPKPEVVSCCPLRRDWDQVEFTDCYSEYWNENGKSASDQGLLTGEVTPPSWGSHDSQDADFSLSGR